MDELDLFVSKRMHGDVYHRAVLTLIALMNMTTSSIMIANTLVWPIMQEQYKFSTSQISMLGVISSVVGIATSGVFVKITYTYGRSKLLKANLLAQVVVGLAVALCDSYVSIAVFWVANGMAIANYFVLYLVYALEVAPLETRGRWTMLINLLGSTGMIITAYLLPRFVGPETHDSWKYPFIALSLLSALLLAPTLWIFKESFRFLLAKGRLGDFVGQFNDIIRMNTGLSKNCVPRDFLINESEVKELAGRMSSQNAHGRAKRPLRVFLSKKYRLITVLLIVMFATSLSVYVGLNIVLPYWLKPQDGWLGPNSMAFTLSSEIFAIVLGYFLIDHKSVGRRRGSQIFGLLMAVTAAGSYFCETAAVLLVFFFLTRLMVVEVLILFQPYVIELYPTWLRGPAYSAINGISSVLLIPLPYAILHLYEWYSYSVILFFAIASAIFFVCSIFLWEDKTQKSLDASFGFAEPIAS